MAELAEAEIYWSQLHTATLKVFNSPTLVKEIAGYWNGPSREKYVFGNYQAGGAAAYIAIVKDGSVVDFYLDVDNMGTMTKEMEEAIVKLLFEASRGEKN